MLRFSSKRSPDVRSDIRGLSFFAKTRMSLRSPLFHFDLRRIVQNDLRSMVVETNLAADVDRLAL
jgi:hypothetical protein